MTTDVRSFADLGVEDAIVKALADAGITTPFPIQELSLPMALAGADLIGQARTGTGKTLAFGIPLVQRVDPTAGHTQALVIVPTRELCLQVHDDLTVAGATRDVKVVAAYGGRSIDTQSEAIAAGAPIVVGTPGRLLDLCRRRLLDLSNATALVLDEADEMLDMGFLPDVEQLIERCRTERQTLLFSATMPSEVVKLARRYMDKPTFMRTDVEQQQHVAPKTRQHFFACHRLDKPAVVARILAAPGRGRTLIFTRTKRMADVLAGELRDRDIPAGVIHSDLRQEARERSLAKFRKGSVDVLCATEVAARGLDIDEVTHVINYDCPDDERMYLHRIGRTGRAGAAGVAVTLAVWNELARLDMIKRSLDIEQSTEEVLSTSPILDDLFGEAPPSARSRSGGRPQNAGKPKQTGRPRRKEDRDVARRVDRVPATDDADDAASEPRADTTTKRSEEDGEIGRGDRPGRRGGRRRSRRRRTVKRSSTTASANAAGVEDDGSPGATSGTAATQPSPSTAPADEDTTTAAQSADTGSAGRTSGRRRRSTRRRRATRQARRSGAGDDGPDTDAGHTTDAQSDGDAGATKRADGRDGRKGATARSPQDAPSAQTPPSRRSEKATSTEPASTNRSRGSRRRRSGRDGGRRGGRSDARRPATDRQDTHRQQPVASPGELRGDGRPALHRPLRITHLP